MYCNLHLELLTDQCWIAEWPPRRALQLFFEAQRQGTTVSEISLETFSSVGSKECDQHFGVDVDEAAIVKL